MHNEHNSSRLVTPHTCAATHLINRFANSLDFYWNIRMPILEQWMLESYPEVVEQLHLHGMYADFAARLDAYREALVHAAAISPVLPASSSLVKSGKNCATACQRSPSIGACKGPWPIRGRSSTRSRQNVGICCHPLSVSSSSGAMCRRSPLDSRTACFVLDGELPPSDVIIPLEGLSSVSGSAIELSG